MGKESIIIQRGGPRPCPVCGEYLDLGDHTECLEAVQRPKAERYHEPIKEDWYADFY